MAKIKPVGVKINGKNTKVPAHYLYEGGTEGTYVQARLLVDALKVGQVHGEGDHINIVTSSQAPAPAPVPAPKPLAGRKIAISAPHTKNANRSTVIKSYYEGNTMFDVAVELKKLLEAEGAKVLQVRTKLEQQLTLKQRTDQINAFKPDVMVEIHSDAYSGSRGVYAIRQIARKNDPLAQLLVDELAKATGLPIHPRKVWTRALPGNSKFDYYHMLRETLYHAVLVECGDHTNAKDMEFLASSGAAKKIAQGAKNAIMKYFK